MLPVKRGKPRIEILLNEDICETKCTKNCHFKQSGFSFVNHFHEWKRTNGKCHYERKRQRHRCKSLDWRESNQTFFTCTLDTNRSIIIKFLHSKWRASGFGCSFFLVVNHYFFSFAALGSAVLLETSNFFSKFLQSAAFKTWPPSYFNFEGFA